MPVQAHPTFHPPPNKHIRIWRYTSLSKFIWTLQKGALYFCRSDLMGDPFEGYYPKPMNQLEEDFVQAQRKDPKLAKIPEETMRKNFRVILDSAKSGRKDLFVNCWHMNDVESFAMWRLYAAQQESICIQSTYNRLAAALPTECFLGTVRYIDYKSGFIDWGNGLNYIVHKRTSFAHEHELRAVVWTPHAGDKFTSIQDRGLAVPISLNNVVESVFVSPDAEPMLVEIVSELARSYGLTAPIHQSELNSPPDW